VRALDKLAWGRESILELESHPDFELYQGDIRHVEDLVASLEGCYGVIHLAGIVGDPACALDPDTTFGINLEATRVIADVARYREVERFVFASTCSVYGAAGDSWLDEGSETAPESLYARTNLQSEAILLEALGASAVVPTILRFGTIYGASARMRFDLVVNIMAAKAASERKVTVFGGEQWRPNLHVRDAARSTIAALEADATLVRGEKFNVGSDEQNHRIAELGELVARQVPGTEVASVAEAPDKRSYRVSFEKIKKVLGFTCTRRVEEGAREVAELVASGSVPDYRQDRYYNVRYQYR